MEYRFPAFATERTRHLIEGRYDPSLRILDDAKQTVLAGDEDKSPWGAMRFYSRIGNAVNAQYWKQLKLLQRRTSGVPDDLHKMMVEGWIEEHQTEESRAIEDLYEERHYTEEWFKCLQPDIAQTLYAEIGQRVAAHWQETYLGQDPDAIQRSINERRQRERVLGEVTRDIGQASLAQLVEIRDILTRSGEEA